MWVLDHKEGWAWKNWCFWTVMLQKTLENPLDYKGMKPINPKGNQPWIFSGRSDAEADALIFWPLDVKNWLTGKDPDAGKDWHRGRGGQWRKRWLDNITDSTDMTLSKFWEIMEYRGAWHTAVHGVVKSWTQISDWTTVGNLMTW